MLRYKVNMSEGGYILSEEAVQAFQWCLEHDIAQIRWEYKFNFVTMENTDTEVHYYNSKGEEVITK